MIVGDSMATRRLEVTFFEADSGGKKTVASDGFAAIGRRRVRSRAGGRRGLDITRSLPD